MPGLQTRLYLLTLIKIILWFFSFWLYLKAFLNSKNLSDQNNQILLHNLFHCYPTPCSITATCACCKLCRLKFWCHYPAALVSFHMLSSHRCLMMTIGSSADFEYFLHHRKSHHTERSFCASHWSPGGQSSLFSSSPTCVSPTLRDQG